MKLFKKEKKENGNANLIEMAFREAMRELQEERQKNEKLRKDISIFDKENIELKQSNKNLEKNLEVLQVTIENVRNMCKNQNGRVISSKIILKEIGE